MPMVVYIDGDVGFKVPPPNRSTLRPQPVMHDPLRNLKAASNRLATYRKMLVTPEDSDWWIFFNALKALCRFSYSRTAFLMVYFRLSVVYLCVSMFRAMFSCYLVYLLTVSSLMPRLFTLR